eukprot:TRINITY_DN7520_c0_g1_i1.p1 TRINITY_DN7520_c0_g1~~TRINITY_DN7520_c0_g1_i1.p1  ORF type:complete len:416 (-),score=52.09 TRINITY_DN7520_c0_g1_i1:182-1429(-)
MNTNSVFVLLTIVLFFQLGVGQQTLPYCEAPNDLFVSNFPNLTLRMVQTITRHGDRTMVIRFENDHTLWECNLTFTEIPSLNNNNTTTTDRLYRKSYLNDREVIHPGNCNLGQLTSKGYDQHYRLGAKLRNLYVDTYKFLSANFDPTEVWVRSTDVPRTIQSAQGLLNGFYPRIFQNVNNTISVLNINTIEEEMDDMLPSSTLCPGIDDLIVAIVSDPLYLNYQNKYSALLASLQVILNNNSTPPLFWTEIMDGFSALQCHNMPFPQGVTQQTVNIAYEIAYWQFNFIVENSSYVSYSIGRFYTELLSRMSSVIQGNNQPKFLLYSAHDATIASILSGMGLYETWPAYASHMQIELWSDKTGSQWYVLTKSNGVPVQPLGCTDVLCPFTQFSARLNKFVPTTQQCKSTPSSFPFF